MGYKYACADFTYPLLPHDKVIRLIALLGFDGIDVGLFQNRSHIQPSMVFGDAAKNGRLLKEKTDAAGIAVADVFLQSDVDFEPMAVNHPDAAIRAEARGQFERTLEYAAACGARHVTGLPGVCFGSEPPGDSCGRAYAELGWRVEKARAAGLAYSIEAHLGSISDTPEKALRLLEQVPGLTLTLDYTHFTKIGVPDADIEPLIPHATHFHARGACKGKLQAVISENTVDYARIIGLMKKTGYNGFIGVEYIWMEWENCNRSDNVSESLMLVKLMKEAEIDHGQSDGEH